MGLSASPSPSPDSSKARSTVGKFLGIRAGESLLIGVITNVSIETSALTNDDRGGRSAADLDLVGEIKQSAAGQAQFQRGVTEYPAIGDSVFAVGARELRLVFNASSTSAIEIGHLAQDSSIAAYVDVDDMLSKHFAVLGTTGVGKSSAVVLMLQEILRARPDLRIFVLDAHNEYGRPFGDKALVFNPRNLRLPFWLFNFEEIVDVLFGREPGPTRRSTSSRSHPARQAATTSIVPRLTDRSGHEAIRHGRLFGRLLGTIGSPDRSACSTSAWASSRTDRRG